MRSFKIHLIRHGLSEGALEGKYIGRMDVSLTEQGKKQLIEMVSDENKTYPCADVVISSPLKRCIETAKIIYPDKEPLIFDDLTEYDFGEFDGKTADELKDSEEFNAWLKGGGDVGTPYGETNNDFLKRVYDCFTKIVEGISVTELRSVVIITHGGVIMTIMQYFALPENPMHEWLMPNGCGYTLNFNTHIWNLLKKIEAFGQIPKENDDYFDDTMNDINIYY